MVIQSMHTIVSRLFAPNLGFGRGTRIIIRPRSIDNLDVLSSEFKNIRDMNVLVLAGKNELSRNASGYTFIACPGPKFLD